jgi:methyl-accepting chemotaxis protein
MYNYSGKQKMKNSTVAMKLGLGFGAILLMLAISVGIAINRLELINAGLDEVVNDQYPKTILANDLQEHVNIIARALRNALLVDNKETMEQELARIDEERKALAKSMAALTESIKSTEGKALLADIASASNEILPAQDTMIRLIRDAKKQEALALLLGDYRKQQRAYFDAIEHLTRFQSKLVTDSAKEATVNFKSARGLLTVLDVVGTLLGIAVSFFIIRTLRRQLGGEPDFVANLANKIAAGDLSTQINIKAGDTTSVMAAMKHMSDVIKAVLADMDHMAAEHDKGDIDVIVDSSKFEGSYQAMAQGVNNMVGSHIAVKKQTMAVFKAFGEGNLDADIAKLPGKRAFVNEAIDQIRANIKSVLADTDSLIKAAAEGRLDVRADAAKHQGEYRRLVQGINDIIDGIVLPLNETVEVLTLVEQGDLTRTVNGNYQGQLGDFKDTLNGTVAKLSQTIADVIIAADQLGNASQQINATSQSLSQASNEQAASVEETTASIEEMSASIQQNSENAKITDGIATQTAQEASQGGIAVKQTVKAMKDIAGKIGIIDDIAYQTNMLALNAAIEAARAGEHGKGFAVVAAEVRKLAERSQIAAKEIGELAQSSVKTAEDAGQLLDAIVPSISKTSNLVQEIAAASQEQSSGVSQINTAMMQMNTLTQQNASASEELAATAEEMTGQAEQLQTLMSFFKIHASATSLGQAKTDAKVSSRSVAPVVRRQVEYDQGKFQKF